MGTGCFGGALSCCCSCICLSIRCLSLVILGSLASVSIVVNLVMHSSLWLTGGAWFLSAVHPGHDGVEPCFSTSDRWSLKLRIWCGRSVGSTASVLSSITLGWMAVVLTPGFSSQAVLFIRRALSMSHLTVGFETGLKDLALSMPSSVPIRYSLELII